jgi:GNAT superfamily N-acetyltransferase
MEEPFMQADLIRISPSTLPDYRERISPVSEAVWPEFMMHDSIANQYWDGLFEDFGEYQFAFVDRAHENVVGLANSVPLVWDGSIDDLPDEGWDWALIQSAHDRSKGKKPNILCAIQISIHPDFQRRGLSNHLLEEMRELGRQKGLHGLIAPVRPSLKARYPITDMDSYIQWTDEAGLPFDPWLRVHVRQGGRIVKVCHQAMRVVASIQEWESWTEMRFPQDGSYIVPGALATIQVDHDLNRGTYVEPNVWVEHPPAHT